ncbi:alpha-amylase [Virgibacillus natechei]|uniref:Alpha-amylase n=1 Tax=Virgibacillus natechei TaxID=1216297 RepID=A0ABS4IDN1_9BACI|nr:alpha-amylase family glycosyl hydrolase [Virgibacillus natechei]MBP1969015.1 alpha-amylase [Virgibacillus natechei]UZD14291.1 alpha-amylase family glycosyl hydrolase [Virgibacillus natechei]
MKRMAFMLIIIGFFLYNVTSIDSSAQEDRQLEEEIIYNIVVDRFNNGDFERNEQVRIDDPYAYHGGDLQGIINRLDDIQELGVTTISLSPIMENALDGYHGYWIEDFYSVEEQFGEMEDFHELIDEAHKRDMKVVMEFVTNYVGSSHSIVDDPEREDWIQEGNDVTADWADNVAVLNQDNPEVEAFLMDVARFWMEETDIDGFELHAVDQSSFSFLESFTAQIKEIDENFYLLGDILDTDQASEQLKEITEIDMIENQDLFESMTEVFAEEGNPVSAIYETWEESGSYSDLLYVDSKDTKRFSQMFAENGRNDLTTWSLALTYMYTTPGVPVIFQGSEMPMYGTDTAEVQQLVQFNAGSDELNEFHSRISSLRTQFPALKYGDFEQVGTSGAMSVFKRTYEDEEIYIAINNDTVLQAVSVSDIESGTRLRGHLGDNIVLEEDNGEHKIGLDRETAEVFVVETDTGLNWMFIGFIGVVFLLFIGGVIYLTRKQKRSE